jgi:hypothetical protein
MNNEQVNSWKEVIVTFSMILFRHSPESFYILLMVYLTTLLICKCIQRCIKGLLANDELEGMREEAVVP